MVWPRLLHCLLLPISGSARSDSLLQQQAEVPPYSEPAATARRRGFFFAASLLLVFALAKFVYQDTFRLAYPVNDLTTPWVSSKTFMLGKNPYSDIQEFERIWAATPISKPSLCSDIPCILSAYPMAYPPTALALIAPLGLVPWRTAVYAYLAGSAVLVLGALLLLAQKLRFPWRDPRKFYFIAFALALAPLHSSIHEVNLNTAVIACLCAAIGFMSTRPYLSGIAIAIGMCLKPQVAIFFFAYPWLRKKWKTAFAALAAGMAISAGSLIWMSVHHVHWLKAYLSELSQFSSPQVSANFYYYAERGNFQLLNLQILAFQLTHSPRWSSILSWSTFTLFAAISVFLICTRVSEKNESIGIAIISILTLLPFYQRYYTAEILLFVLFWAVENWRLKSAKATHLLMLPLLLPLAAMTENVSVVARFVQEKHLESNFIWNGFVMPHVIWIELLLLLLLLANLYRQARAPAAMRACRDA
ncbi:MAG: DUF2029 domain-containing protein [Acidobacteriota bacterium]|nr:DUF2029 domain-containing protein [Acidobacteriota bacterium]